MTQPACLHGPPMSDPAYRVFADPRADLLVAASASASATIRFRSYATSKIASTSTVMFDGRDPIPTADRAGRPESPKTSTNRSVQPLMTFG